MRWRSCAINKGLGKVISNLATVFLLVTLLGKHWRLRRPSVSGGRSSKAMQGSWDGRSRRQEGTGLLLSPAVLSLSSPDQRAAPGQKVTKKKAKKEMRGFKYRL